MKKCISCKKEYNKEQFHSSNSTKDGLHPYCKTCKKEMDRLNYIKTRVRRLEHAKSRRGVANQQAKESHKRLRIEVLKHYSNGLMICDCCPENRYEFLTIDHIKGGGTKHRKIVKNMYRWLKKNNYPDGYRVLCMNCNYSYGHYGYCPHQQK